MDRVKEEVIEGDSAPWMDSGVAVKQEPAWSMEEDSPDQPSAVYSTAQPMSDYTPGSLHSPNAIRVCHCQHCSAAFVLVSSLELHLASVHGEPLQLPEWTDSSDRQKLEPAWSMQEDSPDQLAAVYSTEQPMSENAFGSQLFLNTSCVCQHCSAAFVLVSGLELHLALVHGEKLHMVLPWSSTPAGNCSNTDTETEVDSQSNRKITSKKKIDGNDTGVKDGKKRRQNVCDVCGDRFPDPGHLMRHKLIHTGIKIFVCDVCSKSYTQASHLKKHKLTHSNLKPFVCDVCSQSFPQAGNLTRHKKIHTGERPFKCPHCDSDFKRSGDLQYHVNSVHYGARPHVCNVCGAAFSKKSILTSHRITHTGEKPHVCSECGKGFAQSSSLARHRRTHSGKKPHSCHERKLSFTSSRP